MKQSDWLTGLTVLFLVPVSVFISRNMIVQGETGATTMPGHTQRELTERLQLFADGQQDCAPLLQAAVDSGVAEIRFPVGQFRLDSSVQVNLAETGYVSFSAAGTTTLQMYGAGPAIDFQGSHQGTAAPPTVQEKIWNEERFPSVTGLEIVGRHPSADGIHARGTMQLTISRCLIRRVRHAIHLTERNRNVLISECHLYENSGIGIFLDRLNLHQINICNCHISYNRLGGIVSRLSEIRNLQIGTCDIEGNMGDEQGPPAANIELDSRESSIGEVTIVGCTIQHAHEAKHSANIRIHGRSQAVKFTAETRHGHITIADNILSDVQFNLDLQNLRGVTITGNTIWKGYEYDLRATDCQDVVIANNVFDNNPRYHYGDGSQARRGLYLAACSQCLLSGNLISGRVEQPGAVQMTGCQRMNIQGNSLFETETIPIFLQSSNDQLVQGNLLRDSSQPAPVELQIIDCQNLTTDLPVSNADKR